MGIVIMNKKNNNSFTENISFKLTDYDNYYKKLKNNESFPIELKYMEIQQDFFDDKLKRLHELCCSDSLDIGSFIDTVRDIQPGVLNSLKSLDLNNSDLLQ